MNISLEKVEVFRKLVADNSNYTKLCSKEEIEILKKHYSKPVSKQKYLKTKSKYLKAVLNFYKMYDLKYYAILMANMNRNIIMKPKGKTISYLDINKTFINIKNDDSDLFRLVHELAHFVDFKLHKDIINSNAYYSFLPETFSFYIEKEFIKLVGLKYESIVKIRQNNHYLAMQEKLNNLLLMQKYEKYYLENGSLPPDLEISEVQKILDLKLKNVINNIDAYLDIATNNGVNAIVVDLKDGALAYPMEIAKEYSMTAYNTAINSYDSYKNAIDKIKNAGIYVIGRIVVFNDSHYGKDHPEDCIKSNASSQLWPSAYSRGAWEYNVELAKQAIHDMGFNEIQFDYVRFPEQAYNMSQSSSTDFKNKYEEEKAEAVQNFLFYATDQIHKEQVYLSVDVFGECSGTYVTSYGQYWPAISNIVDVVSSMPYTDHFGRNVDTWTNAYQTVNNWAKGAAERQTEIPTPAIARTWITAYDTPYWNPTVTYDATKISDQARALVDAGLTGGFITWNSSSNINKYNQIKSAFAKDY